MKSKIRIVFISSGMQTGGAELMLYRLVKNINKEIFDVHVVSLTSGGDTGGMFASIGIPVFSLNMSSFFGVLYSFFKLVIFLVRIKPHIVQTWMYHADLVGGLAAKFAGTQKVIWAIRNSNLDSDSTKRSTLTVVRICAFLSKFVPDLILSCSDAAKIIHIENGYDTNKFMVLPNGFELERFFPDEFARVRIRAQFGINNRTRIVGIVGRFHPQKNHIGFVKAASLVAKSVPDVRFFMIGDGLDKFNSELVETIKLVKLTDRVLLLGKRSDIPSLMTAFDVLVSASTFGEAFPNVLGEAMACGVPCVTTDVGDSAMIVGHTGLIVSPGNIEELSSAVIQVLNMSNRERQMLAAAARNRVEQLFDLPVVVKRYESLYSSFGACLID
jgi:glycosyltransferase involved in cell wall biosynthesis